MLVANCCKSFTGKKGEQIKSYLRRDFLLQTNRIRQITKIYRKYFLVIFVFKIRLLTGEKVYRLQFYLSTLLGMLKNKHMGISCGIRYDRMNIVWKYVFEMNRTNDKIVERWWDEIRLSKMMFMLFQNKWLIIISSN